MTREEKSYIGFNEVEAKELLLSIGAEAFRYEQIQNWIFDNFVENWEEMENLPKDLIELLSNKIQLHPLQINLVSGSEYEPTQKFLFKTKSGHSIESVLMHEKKRTTVCISSQVGCAVDCKFCATASMGFIKNLNAYEIIDQVLHLERISKHKITNIVFMGMGEPLFQNTRLQILYLWEWVNLS